MKKTFLTFLLAGANFMLVADETQTKFSPPKPDTTGIIVWHDDQTMHEYDHNLVKQWWYDPYIDGLTIDVEQSGETWETKDMSQAWTYGYGGTANSTWTIDNTVTNEEWDYDIEGPVWITTSDPQTKYVGGFLYSANGLGPYDAATWTGDTNGIGLNRPLGCEVCEVENNSDTHAYDPTFLVESQTNHRYKRQAHTVLALCSGGRAIPGRQILHEISGWAKHIPGPYTQYLHPPYVDYWPYEGYTWFHYLPCVSNNLVRLLGNTLHDDPNYPAYPDQPVKGTLYYVTPAGAKPIRFTPEVSGDRYFAWGVSDLSNNQNARPSFSDAPYPLTIHLSTSTTNVDLSTNVPEVCVGQNVNFTTSWGGPPPNTANVEWVHWHLPGEFVNEGYSYPASCYTYRKNPNLLEGWTTHCWYQNQPGGACSIGTRLLMSNGQTVNVASSGSFTVYKPSVQFVPGIAGTPAISPSGQTLPPVIIESGGVLFSAAVTSKYYGFANWTQLIKRYVIGGDPHYLSMNTWGDFYLDNTLFYNTPDGGTVPVHTQITPGTAITVPFGNDGLIAGSGDNPQIEYYYNWASITDNFKTFLVFRPAGDGIWVTLGRVDWGWSADANGSTLTSATPISPAFTPMDDFPLWSNIYVNGNQ